MANDPQLSVIAGRLVTMNGSVIDDGRLFLKGDRIEAVRGTGEMAPAGYEKAMNIVAGGTVYPGLIDLHGHLAYNVLSPWRVPKPYENRSQWMGSPDYKSEVSGPMGLLLKSGTAARAAALVRYVEVKALVGGATTVQGLRSRFGMGESLYRGLVRNVEAPDVPGLPEAGSTIGDLKEADVPKLEAWLKRSGPHFFHLAEGIDEKAHAQYKLLADHQLLRSNLVCIHCVGLSSVDHQALHTAGTRTVWSPLSNLLLYGRTLNVSDLSAPFALGCDWSPSGSRNLLQELKVAWLVARAQGNELPYEAFTQAVTSSAAKVTMWDSELGTLTTGKLADLLVLESRYADPFENLVRATERDVRGVFLDGVARYGDIDLMQQAQPDVTVLEQLVVGGRTRALHLTQAGSPLAGISLAQATVVLRKALADLTQAPLIPLWSTDAEAAVPEASVELDMQPEVEGGVEEAASFATKPIKVNIELDPLTVVDDPGYFDFFDSQINLPSELKGPDGLRSFYRSPA